jgi:hypothetical protein
MSQKLVKLSKLDFQLHLPISILSNADLNVAIEHTEDFSQFILLNCLRDVTDIQTYHSLVAFLFSY